MSAPLVAYFSATGATAKVAKKLAEALHADIYEIRSEVKYTRADLNWMNKKSRSSGLGEHAISNRQRALEDHRIFFDFHGSNAHSDPPRFKNRIILFFGII